MSRRVQLVLLCEDSQHESFMRRFLQKKGFSNRTMRVERGSGTGLAPDAWVCRRFPTELEEIRKSQVTRALAVMIDGDKGGVDARLRQLEEECTKQGIEPRSSDEAVAIFVPTWRIETWIAYLSGETVDESKKDAYPKLDRQRECRSQVDALFDMCHQGALRDPAPPSLRSACDEYKRIDSAGK